MGQLLQLLRILLQSRGSKPASTSTTSECWGAPGSRRPALTSSRSSSGFWLSATLSFQMVHHASLSLVIRSTPSSCHHHNLQPRSGCWNVGSRLLTQNACLACIAMLTNQRKALYVFMLQLNDTTILYGSHFCIARALMTSVCMTQQVHSNNDQRAAIQSHLVDALIHTVPCCVCL